MFILRFAQRFRSVE